MDFGFDRFDLTKITRKIELPEITVPGRPVLTLVVRYAGPGNRNWEAAQFRANAVRKPAPTESPAEPAPDPDPDAAYAALMVTAERNRRELTEMLAGPVLTGWENVFDDDRPVAFSIDTARQFLDEMMAKVWSIFNDRMARYVVDQANFRTAPVVDPVDLGKG